MVCAIKVVFHLESPQLQRDVELVLTKSIPSPYHWAGLAGKLLVEIDDEMLSHDLLMSSKLHRKRFLLAIGNFEE